MATMTTEQLAKYDANIKKHIDQQILKATTSLQSQIDALKKENTQLINSIQALSAPMTLSAESSPAGIAVEEDIQEDYIIYNREIKPNENIQYKNIVVTGDDRSNRIFFNMYYTFDDRELESKEITIIWINAKGDKGESLCVDKSLNGNRLTFAWDIPATATYADGVIRFAIKITADEYIWNSLPYSINCVKGLLTQQFNNLQDAKLQPGWTDYIEGKYQIGIKVMYKPDYIALPEKDPNILYIVIDDTDTSLYFRDRYVNNIKWEDA